MELIDKARAFAEKAHAGQVRKLTNEPYFIHTEGVAVILQEAGLSPEVVASGYLHDTVEDTIVTIDQIKREFGERVAALVSANTEDKTKSWEERKEQTIESVKHSSIEIKCLIAADKLDNLRSLISASSTNENIWIHFNRGKDQQAWYYKGVAEAIFEGIETEDIPLFFDEFHTLVNNYFND